MEVLEYFPDIEFFMELVCQLNTKLHGTIYSFNTIQLNVFFWKMLELTTDHWVVDLAGPIEVI